MTVGESDVNFQQEKERLACEWLAKLKPVLGLDDDVHTKKKNTTASTANQRTTTTKGAEKRSSGAKGKYADISDDDDDDDENAEGAEKENFVKRQREVFYKEAIHLMDIWFAPDNGEKQEKEEKERVKTILRKVRSDPPIAPDEPVPITLRPYDVTPGDTSRDVKFVYKHALTTVHEVKRQMAKHFKYPIEALDLVLGGKKLSNEKTLLECAVCAGFVVYLRADLAVANHVMTTTLDIAPGQRMPITRLTMKEMGKWVVE